ncbi:hypothetical protein AOQ84DRAFT_336604 [Glonium stellatum]|uniref:Thioredoxin-like fold domain-containing protein n=1 Tax=Glonium stellatum TaxID=574774 RepID=A0A8E2JVS0_9PEZI|nr:hypothetical protein AOQ84DRAFT_336604 [Glonium stellatum]
MSDTIEDKTKLIVYRGWLDRGKHVWSPFVIKLEARLRFAGVTYITEAGSTLTAPKGKIPYIKYREIDDSPTTTLGDSTLIIKHLVERNILPNINANVPPTTRAQDLALRSLLEEKLYFYHTWELWDQNYYQMREHILQGLPYPMRVVIGLLIHRNTMKTLNGQGTNRHTPEEIRAFREEIWEAINELLLSSKTTKGSADGRPFWILGGEGPTEADATLFGFIVCVLVCTARQESQRLVKGFPIILEYAERIHDIYFPDYEKWGQ